MSIGGFNQLILIGKLINDPQLQYVAGGKARCNLVMVCTDHYINEDQVAVEQSNHFSIVFWNEEAERLHRLCRKGALILAEGRLSSRKGNMEIWGNRFSLLNKEPETPLQAWPEASQTIGTFDAMRKLTEPEGKDLT